MLKNRLKQEREKRDLSQRELSQMINVSQQTIGSWETGRTEPNSDTLQQLANFFGVSVDYLLGRSIDGQSLQMNSEDNKEDLKEKFYQLLDILKNNDINIFNGKEMQRQTQFELFSDIKSALENAEKMEELRKKTEE
ncbi:MAG: XRE family transcriptional regulator [Tenericutes bacterium HGW-Tenericutes-1]|jgi:transcriptional regulator with XRE-family HTH domain|nr:MAG: XRE family transcriptional regulator [Tenericutes bacterium HGW-Tenericutes-1]PKM95780.1 MAG: XRE family transcriptional regulator [Firmicutes bacterium HGW-Firmicutes-1]